MSGIVGNIEAKSGLLNRRHTFYVRMASNQEQSGGGDYKLNLDTITYDTSNIWDTTNKRMTSPVTGHWQFNFSMRPPDHQYWIVVSFKYNNAYINQGKCMVGANSDVNNTRDTLTLSPIIWMVAGSTLEVWWHPQGNSTVLSTLGDGTSTSNSITWLNGYYLGNYGKGNPP